MEVLALILLLAYLGVTGYWIMNKIVHFCTDSQVQNGDSTPEKTKKHKKCRELICHPR